MVLRGSSGTNTTRLGTLNFARRCSSSRRIVASSILAPAFSTTTAVTPSPIPGDEEAIPAEFGGGLLGHPPVTREHIRAAHFDHADRVRLLEHRATFRIRDANLDARQRWTHRAWNSLAAIRVGGVHERF